MPFTASLDSDPPKLFFFFKRTICLVLNIVNEVFTLPRESLASVCARACVCVSEREWCLEVDKTQEHKMKMKRKSFEF